MTTLLLFLFFLIMEGFFTGNETAFVSVTSTYLKFLASKNSRAAKYALKLLKHPERFLSTTLIGTNVCVVASSTLVTKYVYSIVGKQYAFLITIAFVTPLVWIFGEILPKTIYRMRAQSIVLYTVYPMRFFYFLFSPFVLLFASITKGIIRMLNVRPSRQTGNTKEMTMFLKEYLPDNLNIFFENIVAFDSLKIKDIMIDWKDVVKIEEDLKVEQALKLFREKQIYRLPVILKKQPKILTLFDLIDEPPDKNISEICASALTLSGSEKITGALSKMKEKQQLLAIVKTNKKFAGIVTLEMITDLLITDA